MQFLVAVWLGMMTRGLYAQTVTTDPAETTTIENKENGDQKERAASTGEQLALQQQRIAEKYKHLEGVLLRMRELNVKNDPRRAALLEKAIKQSAEENVLVRFDRLVELLGKDQLSRAIENEKELDQDLKSILDLLLSENRAKTTRIGESPASRVPQTGERYPPPPEGGPRPNANGRRRRSLGDGTIQALRESRRFG